MRPARKASGMCAGCGGVFGALAFLVLAGASGCTGGDDADYCVVPGGTCDILDRACQREIYQATKCAGDYAGAEVPLVRTLTVDEVEAELLDQIAENPSETSAGWTEAMQLLGLIPFGMGSNEATVSASVANLAAYYDPDTGRVTVVDRGTDIDPTDAMFELSHEFVHALRDAETDLTAFSEHFAHSTESYTAITSLVEGEAMVVSAGVIARSLGHSERDFDYDAFGHSILDDVLDSIDETDAPLISAVQGLPYPLGTLRLGARWALFGREVLDAQYAHPDVSLDAWLPGAVAAAELRCYPTTPPPGYVGEDHDALAAIGPLALLPGLDVLPAAAALELGRQVQRDSIVLFRPEDENESARAVAWRIQFDSRSHAADFEQKVGCCLPLAGRAQLDGDEVLLFSATDAALLDAWTGVADCGTEDELPVGVGNMMSPMQELR